MNILWGAVILIVGLIIIVFAEPIYNFTGAIDFVESRSAGSTRGFIKFVGVIMTISGILFMTGTLGFILGPFAETLLGIFGLNKK